MSIAEYLVDPWKKSHKAYSYSAFGIRPAPEFATSEVVVSSLYRASSSLPTDKASNTLFQRASASSAVGEPI